MERFDVVIVGAGIVGLATARAVRRQHPDRSVLVVDKEQRIAAHQTGRNSGVIHSGIYYKPGSLKARTVAVGRTELIDMCEARGVAYDICGKVIVAVRHDELEQLNVLDQRAAQNGVEAERISRDQLRAIEPHCEGLAALRVPSAGIVDYVGLCQVMADDLAEGGEVRMGCEVVGVTEGANSVVVQTTKGEIEADVLVNCAGLQSDRIANLCNANPEGIRIMPFRGEYYELVPERRSLTKHLIYPVPDPRFPFLGVHFTRMINGEVHAGPNAVAAFKREGYSWAEVEIPDVIEILKSPSSWQLARRYWKTGAGEMYRSASKDAFVKALQALIPEVEAEDLVKAEAGVRAQAIRPDGTLLDDFALGESRRTVQVINAPSPAATAALEIGRTIATKVSDRL